MKILTLTDYQRAALLLGVDTPTVQAVTVVESSGLGFLSDGRIVLRYEPHIFSKYTKGRFDQSHPHLSFPAWKPGYPATIALSYKLFTEAAQLDGLAAGLSCSYGLFQIMGFNFSSCGCKTFKEFYTRMNASEAEQLNLFCTYIDVMGLDDELRRRDWAAFALAYNGKQFKRNFYDTKLATAYAKFRAHE